MYNYMNIICTSILVVTSLGSIQILVWLSKPQEGLYKPPKNSSVQCQDSLCVAIQRKEHNCANPTDRCEYVLQYDDNSSTHGYLVRDHFHLRLFNGSIIHSPLVFGCGYKQTEDFDGVGIVGLSRGPIDFLSQMHSQGLIQQVVGHCLSSRGGGFLFLGDDLVSLLGVSWTPMTNNYGNGYLSGPVELLLGGSSTQNLTLSFTDVPNVELNLPLQAYLILVRVNRCLSIYGADQAELEYPDVIGGTAICRMALTILRTN
ncbi:aspartyl protease APCB1-like [Tripterygium wilfordii]|uniref:aspartyl protease APCB1-like n=1 Tax=Tripterygium wilfordii TaxID=458696 RepID=UPI0018F86037|nr:aspartyl protease APCB1-like [Tripterygium wilfordii]